VARRRSEYVPFFENMIRNAPSIYSPSHPRRDRVEIGRDPPRVGEPTYGVPTNVVTLWAPRDTVNRELATVTGVCAARLLFASVT
jgi:hypothetical protein